jgi:hypothetical protein
MMGRGKRPQGGGVIVDEKSARVRIISLGDLATGTSMGIAVALGCTGACCGSQRMGENSHW